jgi:hypothetical protein
MGSNPRRDAHVVDLVAAARAAVAGSPPTTVATFDEYVLSAVRGTAEAAQPPRGKVRTTR